MEVAAVNEGNFAFGSICRCCLSNEVQLKPIFNTIGSIPEAIFVFTAVKFTNDDGLPGSICTNCLHQLDKCISFKRRVEAADLILRTYFTDLREKIIEDSRVLEHPSSKENETHGYAAEDGTVSSVEDGSTHKKLSAGFICAVCRRSYASKSTYNRHVKVHNAKDDTFRCNECGKRFTDRVIFEAHQNCHNQDKVTILASTGQPYTCQICKDNFGVEQDLFIHGSLHENANKFNCKGCDKDFENLAKLKRHIPRHFIEKSFKCKKCGMGFAEMASLTRHYTKHIEMNQKSVHTCSVCGKGFPSQYTLKVHTRNHTGERPWTCTKCDKRFSDYRLLNSHKKLHEETKAYECEKCKNRFRHLSTLTTHMRTHTGDRPYRCDQCKKSYKQLWSLRNHKRIHNRKYLVCGQCTQEFTTSASLKDHQQWHSGQVTSNNQDPHTEAPPEFFHCKDCSAQFSSPLDLITHEKLTHALSHECDTCFGKWKTLEELVQHKCNEALDVSDEPTPDEMILLPNGEIKDCNTVVNALLATISHPPTETDQKGPTAK